MAKDFLGTTLESNKFLYSRGVLGTLPNIFDIAFLSKLKKVSLVDV